VYLFFDTETTGLPRTYRASIKDLENWPRVVQLAWLMYSNYGKLLSENDYIIKPDGFIIPQEAIKIHGITTKKALTDGIDLEPVLTQFAKDVKKASLVVAHNIDFDEKIIAAEFFRKNINHSLNKRPKICTMRSSTDFCKIPGYYSKYKWPNLRELHSTLFDHDFEDVHNALADVKACAKCFFELKKQGVIKF
jgi:DNA polymerase III epsilon subunit-like protein